MIYAPLRDTDLFEGYPNSNPQKSRHMGKFYFLETPKKCEHFTFDSSFSWSVCNGV